MDKLSFRDYPSDRFRTCRLHQILELIQRIFRVIVLPCTDTDQNYPFLFFFYFIKCHIILPCQISFRPGSNLLIQSALLLISFRNLCI